MGVSGETERLDTELTKLAESELTRAQVDSKLAELGRYLEVDDLFLDDDGMAVIELEDGLSVSLLHLPGSPGLTTTAPVANAESIPTELLVQLLQSNMDWELTEGGTLGVDPTGTYVLVSRLLIVADRSAEQMEDDLAGFLTLARGWRDEILAFVGEDDGPQAPGPAPDTGFVRV